MKMQEFMRNWDYYMSIEQMMVNTQNYVAHEEKNQDTYSSEFLKIINLSCSAIESLIKTLANHCEIELTPKTMKGYSEFLLKIFSNIPYAAVYRSIGLNYPWREIAINKPNADLFWWETYNDLKHNLTNSFEKATLNVAQCSLAAFHILLRYAQLTCLSTEEAQYVQSFCKPTYYLFCNLKYEEVFGDPPHKKYIIGLFSKTY